MFLTGDFAPGMLDHPLAFSKELAANKEVLFNFGRTFAEDPAVRFEWYSDFFHSITKPLAWFIIISELALGLLALWWFDKRVYQIAIVLFVSGVFLIRPEGCFLSLLLILAWSQLPDEDGHIHAIYIFYLLLFLSLIITRISFG